jgi:hypothetical protein
MLKKSTSSLYKRIKPTASTAPSNLHHLNTSTKAPIESLTDGTSVNNAREDTMHELADDPVLDNSPQINSKNGTTNHVDVDQAASEPEDAVGVTRMLPEEQEDLSQSVPPSPSVPTEEVASEDQVPASPRERKEQFIHVNSIGSSSAMNYWDSEGADGRRQSSLFGADKTYTSVPPRPSALFLFSGSVLRKGLPRLSSSLRPSFLSKRQTCQQGSTATIPAAKVLCEGSNWGVGEAASFAVSSPRAAAIALALVATQIVSIAIELGVWACAVGWLASLDLSSLASMPVSASNTEPASPHGVMIVAMIWQSVVHMLREIRKGKVDFSLLLASLAPVRESIGKALFSPHDWRTLLHGARGRVISLVDEVSPQLGQVALLLTMRILLNKLVIPMLLRAMEMQSLRRRVLRLKEAEGRAVGGIRSATAAEGRCVALWVKLTTSLVSSVLGICALANMFGPSLSVTGTSLAALLMMLYETYRLFGDAKSSGHSTAVSETKFTDRYA